MPIRLCQKCGLKVLIDESQAGTNPFYCQRCTTAMKGQEGAAAPAPGPITPVKNPTPSPVSMGSRSDPAAPSIGAAKAATVRVLCPYCKASFNGRVPTKPARGSCPVCQKELILLPNGDIKPAAGFDLTSWQNEPAAGPPALKDPTPSPMSGVAAAPPKESGTRLLVKKYAADPAAAAASASPAPRMESHKSPAAETDVSEDASALPPWLDDSSSAPVKPLAETADEIDIVEPKKNDAEDRTIRVEDPLPPPPSPRARPQAVAKMPSMAAGRPPAAIAAAPPADRPITEVPPRRGAGKPLVAKPAAAAPAPVGDYAETGAGKVFFALVLALLPVAACAGLLASRDKLQDQKMVKNIGAAYTKGFTQLNDILFKKPQPPRAKMEEKPREPEPPPKEEPPKADPEQQHKDEIAISHLYNEVLMLKRKYGKEADTAATPQQKSDFQVARDQMTKKEERIKAMRETYQKMYGKDYDPAKD